MAKRSRANRTEKATYQNIRNEHKYIDVVHHGDGHYYIIQYIKHELPERTVVNYMGTRCGHKQKITRKLRRRRRYDKTGISKENWG